MREKQTSETELYGPPCIKPTMWQERCPPHPRVKTRNGYGCPTVPLRGTMGKLLWYTWEASLTADLRLPAKDSFFQGC